MTWELTIDPAAAWGGADPPSLIPVDGPFVLAMRRHVAGVGVSDRVVLELYGYEIVERVREGLATGVAGSRRLAVPFCPVTGCAAADVTHHAVAELLAMLPAGLRWRVEHRDVEAVARAQLEFFGLPVFDPPRYVDLLATGRGPAEPERQVVGAFLRDGDRVLLERRPATARVYPSVWDSPGGHLEVGETSVEALHRELAEELGVRPLRFRRFAVVDDVEPATGLRYRHHVFVVDRFAGEVRAREGQALRWFGLQELGSDPSVLALTARLAVQLSEPRRW